MARQLRQRVTVAKLQPTSEDVRAALPSLERDVAASVEQVLRTQLQGLFARLVAVGPAVAAEVAAETDPQRVAAIVTARIVAVVGSYRTT